VLLQTGEVEDPKDLEKKIDRELAARAKGNIVPLTFDESKRLAPEEVFAGGEGKGGQRGSAAGAVKADDELTKEERKAGRAKRKRKSKAAQEEKDRVKAKRDRAREAQHKAEEDAGFTRKAPKVAMLAVGSAAGKSKSDFSKSSKVFGMLQDAKDADAARGGVAKKSKSDSAKNKPSLKL
jgi:U3 small nucleolar RNA-associated protein MPP10